MRRMLLLAAALTLVAGQALAVTSIKNTKHDLSAASTSGGIKSDYTEICVFCHTPHMADTSNVNAPLWNRDMTGITIGQLYNSATLDVASQPDAVRTQVETSDAPLCLSCHDGGTLANGLLNPPNYNTADPDFSGADVSATADIGLDLHDDHPIGMNYHTVQQLTSTEFEARTGDPGSYKVKDILPLYGANGVMWCSSCHDVHDNTNEPFLAADNDQSALCLTCHIK